MLPYVRLYQIQVPAFEEPNWYFRLHMTNSISPLKAREIWAFCVYPHTIWFSHPVHSNRCYVLQGLCFILAAWVLHYFLRLLPQCQQLRPKSMMFLSQYYILWLYQKLHILLLETYVMQLKSFMSPEIVEFQSHFAFKQSALQYCRKKNMYGQNISVK